jgi:hypothetical protein
MFIATSLQFRVHNREVKQGKGQYVVSLNASQLAGNKRE